LVRLKRARRVRIHLAGNDPSIEGLLVSRGFREYGVAVPQLLIAEGAEPVVLDEARLLMVPRERVIFYEVL
jgi:hypothetical protein